MSQQTVILLLGSNLGDVKKNIDTAVQKIENSGCTILNKSKYLINKPVEFDSINYFCNIAISINTQHSPIQLLSKLKKIEQDMGRISDSVASGHYTDRIIDIDIVSINKLTFSCEKLKIPHHKHLYEREFSRELIEELGM